MKVCGMFTLDLKNQTKLCHDSLENHIINQKLFQPNTNFEDYCNFIDLQYRITEALEQKILPYKEHLKKEFNIDFISRATEVSKELQYINKIPTNLIFKTELKDDFESCLCALYILEGSRHGALVILKKIKSFMPEEYPFYFLKSDFNEFIKRWNLIIEAIEKKSKTSIQTEQNLINLTKSIYKSIERFYDEYSTTIN